MATRKGKASTSRSQGAPKQGAGPVAEQAREVDETASLMPFNENKASEYTGEGALHPPEGTVVTAPSKLAGASTVSETNSNTKAGSAAAPGTNPTVAPLDRVRVDATGERLTTNQGVPVADNQNSLKAGVRGPALLKDFILREKITHFDHERIPERIVHARGSAAHGYFECYKPIPGVTRASLFQEAGKRTPVFVRFSTVAGERGSKDTARDVRGFAVKFYTEEGNWDLVGNNIPVFFIQDAMKFPDLVHAVKPEPHNAMPQAGSAHDTFWDFVSLMPESTHMLLWVMSDRGIPRSFRMMQGFGVHTFRFVNEGGESTFVKFHWSPQQGTHSQVWDEAVKVSGVDPDFHRRDLWEAIEAGDFPEWELGVQLFTDELADAFSFDVLDATKIIPEELVPVQPVGRLVLDRNPDNFFAETEQVAFCAAHVVPGIDFTNDPLLAGRIHSYVDTQLTRLGGPNFHEIPINAPVAAVQNNQREGMHRQAIHRGKVAYEPNSLAGGCPFQAGAAGFVSFPEPIPADEVRGKPEKFAEHFNQATLFFDSQTPSEQAHIAAAFRFELSKVTVPAVRRRVVSMLRNVSEHLAAKVAEGLGMELPKPMPRAIANPPKPEVDRSAALSLTARPGTVGVRTRKVAILVAPGVDAAQVEQFRGPLIEAGAVVRLVGPRIGPLKALKDEVMEVESSLENEPAVLFDGVVIPGGAAHVEALQHDGRAAEFLKDQYRHCKPIVVLGEAVAFAESAGVLRGETDTGLLLETEPDSETVAAFIGALAAHRHFAREKDPPVI